MKEKMANFLVFEIMMEQVLFPVLFELLEVWMEKPTAMCKPFFFPSIKVKSTDNMVSCLSFCVLCLFGT